MSISPALQRDVSCDHTGGVLLSLVFQPRNVQMSEEWSTVSLADSFSQLYNLLRMIDLVFEVLPLKVRAEEFVALSSPGFDLCQLCRGVWAHADLFHPLSWKRKAFWL